MNLIDHRILIPTSPERVWHFVGDLRRNLEWQVNTKGISPLSSTPKPAPGTRYRITQHRGRDQVIEITAWYERFGYEYQIVEGGPFRENKGQIRLQETPEGTVVQWTFSYSGGGLFGSGGKAQEQLIINSLKTLYKLITRSKDVETFQAKSLMREDPGVEARANYRPRHATSLPNESGEGMRVPKSPYAPPTPSSGIPAVPDPQPVPPPAKADKLEDTRPRPALPVDDLPKIEDDTLPFIEDEPEFLSDVAVPSLPPQESPLPAAAVTPQEIQALPAIEPPPALQVIPTTPHEEPNDTAQISVFDVFGLPKPSQTQPMPALSPNVINTVEIDRSPIVPPVIDDLPPTVTIEIPRPPTPQGRLYGSRALYRRKHGKARRRFSQ
jgi:hypothetical protein